MFMDCVVTIHVCFHPSFVKIQLQRCLCSQPTFWIICGNNVYHSKKKRSKYQKQVKYEMCKSVMAQTEEMREQKKKIIYYIISSSYECVGLGYLKVCLSIVDYRID